jgi:hypothetical protein
MRWDDLSIRTTTSARAGVSADPARIAKTATAANASRTSLRHDSRFMIAPCHHFFIAGMMLFPNTGCKGQGDNLM